jgi:hypothetical protein
MNCLVPSGTIALRRIMFLFSPPLLPIVFVKHALLELLQAPKISPVALLLPSVQKEHIFKQNPLTPPTGFVAIVSSATLFKMSQTLTVALIVVFAT